VDEEGGSAALRWRALCGLSLSFSLTHTLFLPLCWSVCAHTFPPDVARGGACHIGEDGVFADGGHRVRVGTIARAGGHAKEAGLWVDRVQAAVRPNTAPRIRAVGTYVSPLPLTASAPAPTSSISVCVSLPLFFWISLGAYSTPVPLSVWAFAGDTHRIQAMSSPTHSTFHPGRVGCSMARLVLPHADGNAAAT
jgi:hypothetical protein